MWWYISVLVILAVVGLISNGLILTSVIKYKILRKKPYVVVVSLATCDLFKVAVLVNILIYSSNDDLYDVCVASSALGMTLLCVTTFHLAAESINRCLLIMYPYRYLQTMKKKYVAMCLFCIWTTPVLVTILLPSVTISNSWIHSLHFQSNMYGCHSGGNKGHNGTSTSSEDNIYVITSHIFIFALPLIIMLISYAFILKVAYENAAKLRNSQVLKQEEQKSHAVTKTKYGSPIIEMVSTSYDTLAASTTSENFAIPVEITHAERPSITACTIKMAESVKKNLKYRKHEIKASKTVLIVISAFIICNAPVFTVSWYDRHYARETTLIIRRILICLSFLQVIIDPVVYFLRLKDFKNARKKCKYVGQTVIRKTIRRF